MKIAIVGSRDYPRPQQVVRYIEQLPYTDVIISGGARGVDRIAEHVARERGMQTIIYPADWEKYGKSAGMIRNREIIEAADKVVCFWDGVSRGTNHSINLAKKLRKPLEIIFP